MKFINILLFFLISCFANAQTITSNGGGGSSSSITANSTLISGCPTSLSLVSRAINCSSGVTALNTFFGADSTVTMSFPDGSVWNNNSLGILSSTSIFCLVCGTSNTSPALTVTNGSAGNIGGIQMMAPNIVAGFGVSNFLGFAFSTDGGIFETFNNVGGVGSQLNNLTLQFYNGSYQYSFDAGGGFNLFPFNNNTTPTSVRSTAFNALNVPAGTLNTAGTNYTFTGAQGTGTGAGGSLIFQVAPAGSSGTAQNALSTVLTLDSTLKATFAGGVNANGATGGTATKYVCSDSSGNWFAQVAAC